MNVRLLSMVLIVFRSNLSKCVILTLVFSVLAHIVLLSYTRRPLAVSLLILCFIITVVILLLLPCYKDPFRNQSLNLFLHSPFQIVVVNPIPRRPFSLVEFQLLLPRDLLTLLLRRS